MSILMALQRGKCFYCHERMTPCQHRSDGRVGPLEATVEHIIPRAVRGRHDSLDWKLAVLAHRKCNVARSDKPLLRRDIARARVIAAEAQTIYTKEI
jgi:5-methylcytosine-specific restriction endonuclease McrA